METSISAVEKLYPLWKKTSNSTLQLQGHTCNVNWKSHNKRTNRRVGTCSFNSQCGEWRRREGSSFVDISDLVAASPILRCFFFFFWLAFLFHSFIFFPVQTKVSHHLLFVHFLISWHLFFGLLNLICIYFWS